MAEFVAKQLQERSDLNTLRVLDLCAGCGVIGLELSWYVRELRNFDFVEIQSIYTSYFKQNMAIVNRPELQLRWHLVNYELLIEPEWKEKFDLIISNPPYFHPEHGMLSPSQFKNRCRFFLDGSFKSYVQAIVNTLSKGGKAFVLLRPLKQHGYDAYIEIQTLLENTRVTVEKIEQIRGTDVILFHKKN